MLAEFLGAVIKKDSRYLLEPVEMNGHMYVMFPRVETINAIAGKQDILSYGIKEKLKFDISVGKCIYQEDFKDGLDVISYAYFEVNIIKGEIPESLLWIEEADLDKADFMLGDDIVLMHISKRKKTKEEILESSYKYLYDKKEMRNGKNFCCTEEK